MWSKALHKIKHIRAQESTTAKTNTGGTRTEDMACINRHQIRILLFVYRHTSNHTHPNTHAHIRFDHIRIGGGKDHFRCHANSIERTIKL
ncbi:Uncharacterised protein [Vibrio cholerae]|nr:Uncharacterised protein [Vibrio cholerae]